MHRPEDDEVLYNNYVWRANIYRRAYFLNGLLLCLLAVTAARTSFAEGYSSDYKLPGEVSVASNGTNSTATTGVPPTKTPTKGTAVAQSTEGQRKSDSGTGLFLFVLFGVDVLVHAALIVAHWSALSSAADVKQRMPTATDVRRERIDAINSFAFHAVDGATKSEMDAECSICLQQYEEGDALKQPFCGHVFHEDCLDLWLKDHDSCPLCKRDLINPMASDTANLHWQGAERSFLSQSVESVRDDLLTSSASTSTCRTTPARRAALASSDSDSISSLDLGSQEESRLGSPTTSTTSFVSTPSPDSSGLSVGDVHGCKSKRGKGNTKSRRSRGSRSRSRNKKGSKSKGLSKKKGKRKSKKSASKSRSKKRTREVDKEGGLHGRAHRSRGRSKREDAGVGRSRSKKMVRVKVKGRRKKNEDRRLNDGGMQWRAVSR